MTLAILFSLKIMESFKHGVATDFQVTPLFSMRREWLVSSQSCKSVDAVALCKRVLRIGTRLHTHTTGTRYGTLIQVDTRHIEVRESTTWYSLTHCAARIRGTFSISIHF